MFTSNKHSVERRGNVFSYEEEIPHVRVKSKVRIRHTIPKNGDYNDEEALIYAGGWLTGIEMNQFCADALAERGRHVITLDHSRRTAPDKINEEAFKTATLTSVIEAVTSSSRVEGLVAKADSEGGIHLISHMTDALDEDDLRVKAAVFAMSAGCHGKDSVLELSVRASLDFITGKRRILDRSLAQSAFRAGRYVVSNPLLSLREISEIARTDLGQKIADLHRAEVPMAFIVGELDNFFSPGRVEESLTLHCGDNRPLIRRMPTDHVGCALDIGVAQETDALLTALVEQAKTKARPAYVLADLIPAQRYGVTDVY